MVLLQWMQGGCAPSGENPVPFPPGGWFDWWTGERIEGGETIIVDAPLGTLPLYVRAGAIIPLLRPTIDTLSPVGEALAGEIESFHNETGRLYVDVTRGPAHRFEMYDGTVLSHTMDAPDSPAGIAIQAGRIFTEGAQFKIMGISELPSAVQMNGSALTEGLGDEDALSGWQYDEASQTLTIRVPAGDHQLSW